MTRPTAAADAAKVKGGPILYFPTVADPITVSYNLSGVKSLQLSPDTIAKIFQRQITKWDDAAIAADNPGVKLPSTSITVARRSDSSGTTQNFTTFLNKASPSVWTLGAGSTVNWPADTQGAPQNAGVAQIITKTDGAIGYVDFSDAQAIGMTYAKVKNADGKYIAPSTAGASLAVAGATVNADLTYDPINVTRPEGVPDHLADVHHRVREPDRRQQGQRHRGVPELHLRRRAEDSPDDRLRTAFEGSADAGEGAGFQDRRPGGRLIVGRAADRGAGASLSRDPASHVASARA